MSNIAIFSSWNAVCGCAEYAYFLASALQNKGHTVIVIAPEFAPGHPENGIRKDGPKVFRLFQSGFTKEATGKSEFKWQEIYKVLEDEKIDIILHSYQDYLYPNKEELNHLISEFKKKLKGRAYIITHDTCYSPELQFGQYNAALIPAKNWNNNPPNGNIKFIPQGIPEFSFEGFDRAKFREDMKLPSIPQKGIEDTNAKFIISTFGLGRCKTEELIKTVNYINHWKMTSSPICVMNFIANPNNYEFYEKLVEKEPALYISKGYLPEVQLANYLHAGDAVAILYENIHHKATSSALRFAIGSLTPVISCLNNWTSDLDKTYAWLSTDGTSAKLTQQIVNLFANYKPERMKLENAQKRLINEIGWSKVADEYTKLFQGKY